MNKLRSRSSTRFAAAALVCSLAVSGTAMAGATLGQFMVGVHVINGCQIAGTRDAGAARLPSSLGFGLKCSRGADFVVTQLPDAPSPEFAQAGEAQPQPIVIRF